MPLPPIHVLVFLILVACIILCGCEEHIPGSLTGMTPPGTRQAPAPSAMPLAAEVPAVLITSPPFDGGVISGDVTIVVQVRHFTLDAQGGTNRPGSGHLIYYRDTVPPVVKGQPAFTMPGTYAVSPSLEHTWTDVTPGTHTFAVQLVNPDTTPLDPPVIDAVDVTAVSPEEISAP